MEMVEVRCKNPHPRLVGKPCNGMLKVGGDWKGHLTVGCPRCYGYINLDFVAKAATDGERLHILTG